MTRTLHLLRHAKSSWDEPDLADADRPLAPRGERAAAKLAGRFAGEGVAPRLVLCSSARRARQTLELIRAALPAGCEVRVEDGLYAAGAPELMARLRKLPAGAREVMLVGHNPGIHELALTLAGETAPARLREGLPTGALVSLRLDTDAWTGLARGRGSVIRVLLPRDL